MEIQCTWFEEQSMLLDVHITHCTVHNTEYQQIYNVRIYTPAVHHLHNINLFYVHTIILTLLYIVWKGDVSLEYEPFRTMRTIVEKRVGGE